MRQEIPLSSKSAPVAQGWTILSYIMLFSMAVSAQPVTGVWKGKIQSTKIELKLVKKGDSLVGTSYYYFSKDNFRRYAVKGFFDDATNNVVWWDDALIESKGPRGGRHPQLAVTQFNCPGEGIMKLDGTTTDADNREGPKSVLNLEKTSTSLFDDEWNYVLENYAVGANDPAIIDSISRLAFATPVEPTRQDPTSSPAIKIAAKQQPAPEQPKQAIVQNPPAKSNEAPLTPEQKFQKRSRNLQTVIPLSGDTLEARFYDDAEIDGDSIAVFLNGQLLEEHIGLTDQPHTLRIPVNRLATDNELVMVAENLGSIPPNTSLMVVIMGDKRYEARLFADEHSSALVRLVKENPGKGTNAGQAPQNAQPK